MWNAVCTVLGRSLLKDHDAVPTSFIRIAPSNAPRGRGFLDREKKLHGAQDLGQNSNPVRNGYWPESTGLESCPRSWMCLLHAWQRRSFTVGWFQEVRSYDH